VLQFGDAARVAPVPVAALEGVSLIEAGAEGSGSTNAALAWKGTPSNTLVTWSKGSSEVLLTLAENLAKAGGKAVLQIAAASTHALVLRADSSLVAGYTAFEKDHALPPKGLVKGRLTRISAATSYSGGYSLGVDAV
jgi:hypothetical protein